MARKSEMKKKRKSSEGYNRKRSLVGYTVKSWKLKWGKENPLSVEHVHMPYIFKEPTAIEDLDYRKVCITIEEI